MMAEEGRMGWGPKLPTFDGALIACGEAGKAHRKTTDERHQTKWIIGGAVDHMSKNLGEGRES